MEGLKGCRVDTQAYKDSYVLSWLPVFYWNVGIVKKNIVNTFLRWQLLNYEYYCIV
jgi:hypothetical protein